MNRKIVENLNTWFTGYVQTFKSKNADWQRNISLKEEHTRRVCMEILHIGKKLGLSDEDLRLAEVMALFHDIGRFEQYVRYGTFVDARSENHAELGIRILREREVLSGLEKSAQELILRTILYHNRAALPEQETENCLFFAKLLRDADKLDIWRVLTDYYRQKGEKRNETLELGLPDTPGISEDVYEDLMAGRIVDIKNLKNLNDFKLLQVGWIYDINFAPTFQRIRQRGYLGTIRDALPESEKIERIFAAAQSFLDKNCLAEQK
jgi:putative nucleotidyltransferase with HDIG domain